MPRVVGGQNLGGPASGVALHGSHALVAAGGAGLYVIDIAVPTSPTIAARLDTPGYAEGVSVAGDLAYVADGGSLRVVDVSAPLAPRQVGAGLEAPGIQAVVVRGALGFASIRESSWPPQRTVLGMDLSDPSRPQEGARTGPFGGSGSARLADTRLFVADHETGLHVFDAPSPQALVPRGRYGSRFGVVDVALAPTPCSPAVRPACAPWTSRHRIPPDPPAPSTHPDRPRAWR